MANLTIGISDLKVCRPPDVLVTYALGSCVGICLLDSATGVGGMSHIMLPDSTQATNGAATPMRFADTAIPMLVNEMVKMGANRSRIRAKIAGGAVMFAATSDRFNIGERNIAAVKSALAVGKRVRGGAHLAEVRVGTDMDLTNHLQIIVQHFVKVHTVLSCFCQNHRKMKTHCPNIKPSHKDRLVIFICRFHATPLIPRA